MSDNPRTMTRRELHAFMVSFVGQVYAHATDPDFDMHPMLHLVESDGREKALTLVADGNPFDRLADLVEETRPVMFCFAVPTWTRDAKTMERDGEGVMVLSETADEREATMIVITRTPLPTPGPHLSGPAMALTRRALLYRETMQ